MGLKTNKETNTSRLNCQYVGSFPVSDGERKLSSSERNQFVIEKLKSCKKKLINGMAVFLEVSPDGVRVLADDEKTIKMAHSLRRISYATAESSNKLFAYVSHQPGSDMEIVCHTFLTKKKDHAEGLSAVLGKLFKQTFAYTLKRRDKLEEAAQKRGANRRWAKQQVAEGHKGTHASGGQRASNPRSTETKEPRRQRDVAVPQQGSATSAMLSEPRERPSASARTNPTNGIVGSVQNQSRPARTVGPSEGQTAAFTRASEPSSPETESPSFPPPSSPSTNGLPGSLQNQSRPERTVGPSEGQTASTSVRANEPSSPKRELEPTRSTPVNVAPPLPKRNISDTNLGFGSSMIPARAPRRNSEPRSTLETQSFPIRRDPANDPPPPLPISEESLGLRSTEKQPRAGNAMAPASEAEIRLHRQLSVPSNLIQPSSPSYPSNDARLGKASNPFMEEVAPTWLPSNGPARALQLTASELLAEAGDVPPPLPRRQWETIESDTAIPPVQENVIGVEEDGGLFMKNKMVGPRASVSLEDEDWYIPGVSREMVTEMLEASDIGTFLVRDSQSQPGHYALTMKVIKGPNNPSGFGNYLVVPVEDGFTLQGFDKVFPDISTLIRHHASHEDGLPCRLVLAGSNPLFQDANGYLVEFMDEENEIYGCLSNCSSMFSELKMNEDPWQ